MKKTKKRRGIALAIVFLAVPLIGILLTVVSRRAIASKQLSEIEKFQGRLFYMTEYGLNYGYKAFGDDIFGTHTHKRELSTGVESVNPATATSSFLFTPDLVAERIFAKDPDGWYAWAWTTTNPEDSLTSSGLTERIRFKVVQVENSGSAVGWEVVCEAQLGTITRTHRMSGDLQNLIDYTVFCAGDREYYNAPMDISGKQHFNGNVFHSGRTDFVDTFSLVAQNIILEQEPDDWLDPLNTLKNVGNSTIVVKPSSGPSISFDSSLHSASGDQGDWIDKMNEVVAADPAQLFQDKNLGAPTIDPPSFESFEPTGFYARKAQDQGVYIDQAKVDAVAAAEPDVNKRWLRKENFWHPGEQRMVDQYIVDIQKMNLTGEFRDMIYSDESVVLTGAGVLPGNMNFVSRGSIIVSGDFNTGSWDGTEVDANQVSAGIQAGGHAYFATDGYLDLILRDPTYQYTNKNNVYSPKPDGKQYERDAAGNLVYNSGEGPGTHEPRLRTTNPQTLNYFGASVEAIPFISGHMQTGHASNRYAIDQPVPIGAGRREHIENLKNWTFNKFGSDIALQTAEMAPYLATGFESQTLDDGLPWIRSHPMRHPDQRNFGHQVPVVENIPHFPRGANRAFWRAF